MLPEGLPAEVASAPAAALFGRFVRVLRLGSGGMGEVYKAWDPTLRRWVALKILLPGAEEVAPWFQREARLAAQLHHPGLVAIHEVGEFQGRPYIAMQYVDGRTLDRVTGLSRATMVSLVRDAAAAIGHAHESGIVHRDLKPENLIVESLPVAREGPEPAWEHRICVLDFGVARAMNSALHLTAGWATIGTPLYMSPEQARGEPPIPASDVYSMGATLYEVLVGAPPIRGDGIQDMLNQIQLREPVPLRAIDPTIPVELEAIVNQCLSKDSRDRYPNGGALAADLDRYLKGVPVEAAGARRAGRGWKWVSRHRLRLSGAAIVVAAVAAAVTWGVRTRVELRGAEARARRTAALSAVVSRARADAQIRWARGDAAGGREALESGMRFCRAALLPGEFAEGHSLLAQLARELGDTGLAEREFSLALELDPFSEGIRTLRGLARAEHLRRERSRLLASIGGVRLLPGPLMPPTAGELEQDFPELAELRKGALADLAEAAPAASHLSEEDRLLAAAVLARLRGVPQEGAADLAKALRNPLPSAEVLVEAIESSLESGDLSGAAALGARGTELWPGHPAIRLSSARVKSRMVTPEAGAARDSGLAEVAREAELAVQQGAEMPDAALLLAVVEMARKRIPEAERAYSLALSSDPSCVTALIGRADARTVLDRPEAAAADYTEAIRRLPEGSPLRDFLHLRQSAPPAPR